jgi:hypothetical protein
MAAYERIEFEQLKTSPLGQCIGMLSRRTGNWQLCTLKFASFLLIFVLHIDLASSALGSTIVAVTDEFFAPATNMINPAPPIHAPGRFVGKFYIIHYSIFLGYTKITFFSRNIDTGAWMDGWESKRHNPTYDW